MFLDVQDDAVNIQLLSFYTFHIIGNDKNKTCGQPKSNPQPIKRMKGIKKGYSKKKDENHKPITKPYFFHKKIDSLKLSIEKKLSTDVK